MQTELNAALPRVRKSELWSANILFTKKWRTGAGPKGYRDLKNRCTVRRAF